MRLVLVFVLIPNLVWAGKPRMWLEKLTGEVHVVRANKAIRVQKEFRLRGGDLVFTGRGGTVRVRDRVTRVDLAPVSVLKVHSRFDLKYGHAWVKVLKQNPKKTRFFLRVPNGRVVSIKPNTEFYVHVARNQQEFNEQMSGKLRYYPRIDRLSQLTNRKKVFARVACKHGKIFVRGNNRKVLELEPGDFTQMEGALTDTSPTRVSPEQMDSSVEALGFRE